MPMWIMRRQIVAFHIVTVMDLRFKMAYAQEYALPIPSRFLIIVTLAFCLLIVLAIGNSAESFSEKNGPIDISMVNSSFVPLTNTDANQVRANVEYKLEKEKLQNQLVNAIMEVYAPNGTLIRTTSIGSGFSLQMSGEQELKTTIRDKSFQSVSLKIVFTDFTKKTPLSNTITDKLKLASIITPSD